MDENLELRKMLWLRHGCDINALYGDDGEMQCGRHRPWIDFKRDPPEEIELKLQAHKQLPTSPPSEPGWFWYKKEEPRWIPVEVIEATYWGNKGRFIVIGIDETGWFSKYADQMKGQWQGPLKRPK